MKQHRYSDKEIDTIIDDATHNPGYREELRRIVKQLKNDYGGEIDATKEIIGMLPSPRITAEDLIGILEFKTTRKIVLPDDKISNNILYKLTFKEAASAINNTLPLTGKVILFYSVRCSMRIRKMLVQSSKATMDLKISGCLMAFRKDELDRWRASL